MTVTFRDRPSVRFDEVVFACHGDQVLPLLADPSDRDRDVFSCFTTTTNTAWLHTDVIPGARDTPLAQQRRPDRGQGRRPEPVQDLRSHCRRRSAARSVLHAHDEGGPPTRSGGRHSRVRSMLLDTIAMPGRFMDDGKDPDLFDHFAIVAQRTNVYTVRDYASIIEYLVQAWDIAGRSVTGEAARAQEELCREAERYVRLAERTAAAIAKQPLRAFSWIRERAV